jgi:hypothetical protein
MLSVVAMILFSAGCKMCCHPYDRCGPVYDNCTGHPYCSCARAGSILSNPPARVEGTTSEEVLEGEADSISATKSQKTAVENEPRRLSEVDRKAGEMRTESKAQSARRMTNQAGEYHSPTVQRR